MHKKQMLRYLLGAMTILMVATAATADAPVASAKPDWLSLGVDYTIVSDYIWRGYNLSEYPGEGREKLNHQLTVSGGVETSVGTFGGGVWFEWFAGQGSLDPNSKNNLQEVDYWLSYANTLGPVSAEVSWLAYHIPHAGGDSHTTYEVCVSLGLDDSVLFGTENPVLNPTVTWNMDVDLGAHNSWFEVGVSHSFPLGEIECLAGTFLKDVTVTPSLTLGIDHRFTRDSTRLGNLLYGLEASYDLGTALGLPDRYGSVSVATFLNFSQGFADDVMDDELFGGCTLSWGW